MGTIQDYFKPATSQQGGTKRKAAGTAEAADIKHGAPAAEAAGSKQAELQAPGRDTCTEARPGHGSLQLQAQLASAPSAQHTHPVRQLATLLQGAASAKKGSLPTVATAGWIDLGDGAAVGFFPRHVPKATEVFQRLLQETPWEQRSVRVLGRTLPQPRLIAYYALDTSQEYTYSGLKLQPLAFTPLLQELRAVAEQLCGAPFNSVLLNQYRDGSDCMGWHSDNETVYGAETTIASFSFGTHRDFVVRSKSDHTLGLKFPLGSGDALVMRGTMQMGWEHCVPRRAPASKYAPRINCTFRLAVHADQGGKRLKHK